MTFSRDQRTWFRLVIYFIFLNIYGFFWVFGYFCNPSVILYGYRERMDWQLNSDQGRFMITNDGKFQSCGEMESRRIPPLTIRVTPSRICEMFSIRP